MRSVACAFLTLALFVSACSKPRPVAEKTYPIKGEVIAIDKRGRQLTIRHGDIPGLMQGMTMPFTVRQDWVLDIAQPGDQISANLAIAGDSSWLEDVAISKNAQTRTQPTFPNGAYVPREAQPGEQVPDFTLTDQDGSRFKLSSLRGQDVVLTFIYTRCPLPDFCIRMSQNFAELDKQLRAENAQNVRLLTVSFDPAFDTPQVLREYGMNHLGEKPGVFRYSTFAAASKDEIKKMADFFGLVYYPEKDQIIHALRTAVIGEDGKIVQVYRGSDWKSAEVMALLHGQPGKGER